MVENKSTVIRNGVFSESLGGGWQPNSRTLWRAVIAMIALFVIYYNVTPDEASEGTKGSNSVAKKPYVYKNLDNEHMRKEFADNEIKDERYRAMMGKDIIKKKKVQLNKVAEGFVRVAAIQFHSEFGNPKRNRKELEKYIRTAAKLDAKIIVLPEAAIPGYANLDEQVFWSSEENPSDDFLDVRKVAEKFNGASFKHFSPIAKELKIYLTVPYIEEHKGKFYNSVNLLDPKGGIAIRYRKQYLWALADPYWAEEGNLGSPVVSTPYGRLGVMICYDMHRVLPELAKNKADIVLHCSALYGSNFGAFFRYKYSKKIKANKVNYVMANWAFPYTPAWEGYGLSRIINSEGKILASRAEQPGNSVLIGEFPISKK